MTSDPELGVCRSLPVSFFAMFIEMYIFLNSVLLNGLQEQLEQILGWGCYYFRYTRRTSEISPTIRPAAHPHLSLSTGSQHKKPHQVTWILTLLTAIGCPLPRMCNMRRRLDRKVLMPNSANSSQVTKPCGPCQPRSIHAPTVSKMSRYTHICRPLTG
jgi:hypothetical protein